MKQKQEEAHIPGVACQQGPPLQVLQGCTHDREAYVITERVTENWPDQVFCTDEEESSVGTEDSCVELECFKQEDASHTALVETQLLNDVVEMGISKEEWAGEHCRAQASTGH